MEGGTTLGAKEGGGGEAPTQTGRRPPLEPTNSVLPVGADGLQLLYERRNVSM